MNTTNMSALDKFLLQYAQFNPVELAESQAYFSARTLQKSESLATIGKVCKEVAFIAEGALKVWYLNRDGDTTVSCFCTAHCLTTAYRSFIRQIPSELGITAIVSTHIYVLQYDDFQHLMATRPIWQELGRKILEQEYLEMEQYANLLNNENAKEKYLRILQNSPEIAQLASVADMASYLGVTRRTLSRIRKEVAQHR
jgi:CRP-like cAMP-binding protein